MNIKDAQKDMREAYLGGSTGVFASGIIWLISGILALSVSKQTTILVFFFGGMLIHPLGILLDKILGRSGKHQKENPLGTLALESTALLFIGLFIAYSIFLTSPGYFFPIMLLTIGGRYLIFQTIYGIRLYWLLGFVLVASGGFLMMTKTAFYIGAISGGIIELVFALLIGKFGNHAVEKKI